MKNNLTRSDYKILNYINKKETVEVSKIESRFSLSICCVEKILDKLCSMQPACAYVSPNGKSGLAIMEDDGKVMLQNYRDNRRDLWFKSCWIPIIVSFVTFVLLTYIVPWAISVIQIKSGGA